MFSISQTSRGFFCLEWSSTEDGPKIISLDHIKIKNNFLEKSTLKKIITNYNLSIKDESNSLAVTINIDNVLISSVDTFQDKENDKIISWYESNIMGKDFCDNYYNYYYPMSCSDKSRFLIVSLPKKIKNNIIDSSNQLGFNIIYLSIDIFSAAVLVQHIYRSVISDKYIIWKICENNSHIIILYNKNKIKAFVRVKKRSKIFVSDYSIGSKSDIDMIINCVNDILIKKSYYDMIENIFIYQTKRDLKVIKDVMNLNHKNLKILNFNKLIKDNTKNTLKYIYYVENGISFKGLDL